MAETMTIRDNDEADQCAVTTYKRRGTRCVEWEKFRKDPSEFRPIVITVDGRDDTHAQRRREVSRDGLRAIVVLGRAYTMNVS